MYTLGENLYSSNFWNKNQIYTGIEAFSQKLESGSTVCHKINVISLDALDFHECLCLQKVVSHALLTRSLQLIICFFYWSKAKPLGILPSCSYVYFLGLWSSAYWGCCGRWQWIRFKVFSSLLLYFCLLTQAFWFGKPASNFLPDRVIFQSRDTVDLTRRQSGQTQFLQFCFLQSYLERPKVNFVNFCFKLITCN